jgi:hypothetical protein
MVMAYDEEEEERRTESFFSIFSFAILLIYFRCKLKNRGWEEVQMEGREWSTS